MNLFLLLTLALVAAISFSSSAQAGTAEDLLQEQQRERLLDEQQHQRPIDDGEVHQQPQPLNQPAIQPDQVAHLAQAPDPMIHAEAQQRGIVDEDPLIANAQREAANHIYTKTGDRRAAKESYTTNEFAKALYPDDPVSAIQRMGRDTVSAFGHIDSTSRS